MAFWKKPTPPEVKPPVSDKEPFLTAFRSSDGGMIVNLDPTQLENGGIAGIILADLLRHFARGMVLAGAPLSEEEMRMEILSRFLMETDNPTDEGIGSIQRS